MPTMKEQAEMIIGLMERVANARKKLGKQPGESMTFYTNCPQCKAKDAMVITSNGKRMLRGKCTARPDCLRFMG